jgi:hypothetical protein
MISPLARKSQSHIYNSMDYIEQISHIKMEKGGEVVSFDLVSLFTSVPRNEAMTELKLRLERDIKLLDRTIGQDDLTHRDDHRPHQHVLKCHIFPTWREILRTE